MRWTNAQRAISVLVTFTAFCSAAPAFAQFASRPGIPVGTAGNACDGTNIVYGWPDSNGQILKCSSNVWQVQGLTTAAGGSNGQVQYNSSGSLAGSSNFVWDNTNGRVGIGTTTPNANLHIVRSGVSADTPTPGTALAIQNDGTTSGIAVLNLLGGTSGSSIVVFGDSGTPRRGSLSYDNTSNSMRFETSQSERMRIDSSGNVGIGTTSPGATFTVGNNGFEVTSVGTTSILANGNSLQIGDGTLATAYTSYAGGRGMTGFDTASGNIVIQGGGGNKGVQFNVNNSTFGSTNGVAMVISGASGIVGNVGIGTTSPITTLHVGANGNSLYVGDTTLASVYMSFNSRAQFGLDVSDGAAYVQGSSGKGVNFVVNGNALSSPAMTITTAGNVGIGTTSPTSLLQVAPAASSGTLSSILTLGGNLSGTASGNAQINLTGTNSGTNHTASIWADYNGNLNLSAAGGGFNLTNINILTLDAGSGSANATLNLVGRNSGTANTASITANQLGGILVQPASTDPTVTIGSTSPVDHNTLSVYGQAAIGQNFITTTAPTNGLIVQGSVGIGTLVPLHALDVADQAVFGTTGNAGRITFRRASDGVANGLIGYNTSGESSIIAISANGGGGTLAFSTAGSERARIDSSGNVGIGTTAPLTPLEIGNGSGQSALFGYTSGITYVGVGGTAGSSGNGRALFGYDPTASNAIVQGTLGHGIEFAVNNAVAGSGVAAIINSSGNVGLGTTSPLNKLDVSGGSVIGAGYIGTTTAPSNGLVVQGNVGIGTNSPNAILHVANKFGSGTDLLFQGDTTSGQLVIEGYTNNNQQLAIGYNTTSDYSFISSIKQGTAWEPLVIWAGNVGIGTTSPNSALRVVGNIGNGAMDGVANTSANHTFYADNSVANVNIANIKLVRNYYDPTGVAAQISFWRKTGATESQIRFGTNGSGATGNTPTDRMTIDDGGNVGIGTTSPIAPLTVQGGVGGTYGVAEFTDGTHTAEIWTGSDATHGNVQIGSYGNDKVGFFTNNAAPKVVIDTTGYLGIGSFTPGTALDVAGTIRATTALLNASSAPTVSSCGGSAAMTAGSSNNGGQVTTGNGSPTACTITFSSAFPNSAFCTITPATSYTGTYYISAQSASAFTFTLGTGTSSAKFNYTCMGN